MSLKKTSQDRLAELERDKLKSRFSSLARLSRHQVFRPNENQTEFLPQGVWPGAVFFADDIEGQGLRNMGERIKLVADEVFISTGRAKYWFALLRGASIFEFTKKFAEFEGERGYSEFSLWFRNDEGIYFGINRNWMEHSSMRCGINLPIEGDYYYELLIYAIAAKSKNSAESSKS